MQERIFPPHTTEDITPTLDTACAWTVGLRTEAGLPIDPEQYEYTRQRLAALYGLDAESLVQRPAVEGIVADLALLHTTSVGEDGPEQLSLIDGTVPDRYQDVPEHVRRAAVTFVSLTIGQAETEDAHYMQNAALRDRSLQQQQHITALSGRCHQLYRQARHDTLTDALNVLGIQEVEGRWVREPDYTRPRAIISIDATCFKEPNDVLGHDVGDQLLKEMVQELKTYTRNSDEVHIARVGGDEFRLALDNISDAGLASWVSRMQDLQQAKVANGRNIAIWKQIRSLRRKGQTDFYITERVVRDGGREETRRYLSAAGKEICSLRELAVLSIGGAGGYVACAEDLESMKHKADIALAVHKSTLHEQMGGAYRTRTQLGFVFKAVQAAKKILSR